MRIIIGDSQGSSAQGVGFLYGSANAYRQAIAASSGRNVSTLSFRVVMDRLTTFQDDGLLAADYFRGHSARLSSVACVLAFRLFSFTYCRAFMSSMCAFGLWSVVGDYSYRYTSDYIRPQDVASKDRGASALGYSRGLGVYLA